MSASVSERSGKEPRIETTDDASPLGLAAPMVGDASATVYDARLMTRTPTSRAAKSNRTARTPIGNSELISNINTRLILEAVRVMQPTYRAAVARRTGLKPATLTVIVNDLIQQGLLEERSPNTGNARWGRPPLMLQVNGDVKRILAIDLEPDRIRVAVTNMLVSIQQFAETRIDRFARPETTCNRILKLCDQVMRGVKPSELLGVGMSLPGLIDREQGVLISSTNMPRWHDVPIAKTIGTHLKARVEVERSVHLAALYEDWSNPQPPDSSTLVISLRTGVGSSLMHRRELYVGNMGFDGEIGHTVIDVNGLPCECGSRGCLETFVSATAICERAQKLIAAGRAQQLAREVSPDNPLTPEMIYRLAKDGDADCAEVVREIGRYLGIAIANLINLFAPNHVVICGSIDMAEDLLLHAVKDQVAKSALPRTREKVTITLAREKEKLPLLGAAVLIARKVFALPRLSHNVATLQRAVDPRTGV